MKLLLLAIVTVTSSTSKTIKLNREKAASKPPSWSLFRPKPNGTYPEEVDWRTSGAVTPVKNQGNCSSDWAFSAIGALEGQLFRKTGNLTELSAQNVLDCTKGLGNSGCEGGFIHKTWDYAMIDGIDPESAYPYEGRDGGCRFSPADVAARVKKYVFVPRGDERALEAAVARIGPVSVGISVSVGSKFGLYHDGVFYDPQCKNGPGDLSVGALVVGYGKENGVKYWLLKSSYGTGWGIGGYMKIVKDLGNHCGVATYASFPVLA